MEILHILLCMLIILVIVIVALAAFFGLAIFVMWIADLIKPYLPKNTKQLSKVGGWLTLIVVVLYLGFIWVMLAIEMCKAWF